MVSQYERKRRLKVADLIMKQEKLNALFIVGNGAVGIRAYGCFRYFIDNRVYYHVQALVALPRQAPTVCCSSITHLKTLQASGYNNVRIDGDILGSSLAVLEKNGISSGRVGVCFEMLPASWYQRMIKSFPRIEWVDITESIFAHRSVRSMEEAEVCRQCAELADIGFQAILNAAKPGVSETELAAELDYAMKKNGAEQTFTLISSGKFRLKKNDFSCLHFPFSPSRVIENGDSIGAEITPRYHGYWTQMVRTFNVGKPNEELTRIHEISCGAIKEGAKLLTPGRRICDVVKRMKAYIEEAGLIPTLPYGHICAVDLNEERVDPASTVMLTPGMAVILHPTITTPNITTSIFWGETYLVTENGGENLMSSSQELITV
jgi:Xaa-Pro aminopeptidase